LGEEDNPIGPFWRNLRDGGGTEIPGQR
jgi:hypothetical protein